MIPGTMRSSFRFCKGPFGVLVALLFWACHDAPRTNPFDPALTPPVELQVALDDTAGTATLTWTRYEGKQPFREYRVLRHIAERTRVDTLALIPEVGQTSFADTTIEPNTAYVYRVETLNAGGYAAPSEEKGIAGFSVEAMRLLGVENDQDSGGLALSWNRYVGPDFASYQVHRRAVGTDREETLAEITAPMDTTFTDQTAQAWLEYVYTVVIEAAGQTQFSNTQEARLTLPPVEITRADFTSTTASASLAWTQYRGARFKAYRVERRSAGLATLVVKETSNIVDTAYVDSLLSGNTEYFYQVVVETERGEELPSEEQSGIFHQLLATWPLAIVSGEYVRLYRKGEGITALAASSSQVRLFFFDTQGALLGEQVLLDNLLNIEPRGVTMSLGLRGQRFLSLNTGSRNTLNSLVSVWLFDAPGKPVLEKTPVFADSLERLPRDYATVQSSIFLIAGLASASFDKVVVSRSGQVLFADDFEGGGLGEWDFGGSTSVVAEGKLISSYIEKTDALWQDFSLEADVVLPGGTGIRSPPWAGIGVGTRGTASYFTLTFNLQLKELDLRWSFTPPEGSVLERQNKSFQAPFPVMANALYRLGLEVAEGEVHAWVSSPVLRLFEREEDTPWTSLAGIEEKLVLVNGSQIYRIILGEIDLVSKFPLISPPSEMRIWESKSTGSTQQWIGICLPERQQVFTGRTGFAKNTGRITWPFNNLASAIALGAAVGQEPGNFLFPLSFDGSEDGRIYVLDAGNARIQVFDIEGKYLTQWGRKGSGEGEFDFGSGRAAEEFAGSVAVDGEGYIYVADVGNKRIQKFAP